MPRTPPSETPRRRRARKRPKKKKDRYEMFAFELESWSFDYGLSFHLDQKRNALFDLCDENLGLSMRGPLVSPTKRKIQAPSAVSVKVVVA